MRSIYRGKKCLWWPMNVGYVRGVEGVYENRGELFRKNDDVWCVGGEWLEFRVGMRGMRVYLRTVCKWMGEIFFKKWTIMVYVFKEDLAIYWLSDVNSWLTDGPWVCTVKLILKKEKKKLEAWILDTSALIIRTGNFPLQSLRASTLQLWGCISAPLHLYQSTQWPPCYVSQI